MRQSLISLSCLLVLAITLASINTAVANTDNVDFSEQYERIYQIRVVSKQAGGKSSIGSGFQVSADGRIVTNFHVISEFVNSPELYDIQYASQNGETGNLTLLDFDIVSDVAVLQHPNASDEFFTLADSTPEKGEMAYALGNPGDWGMVMVPGPTNGLVEHSYEDRVLFSGSLNSGMSGGPSLNRNGDVIGVNVATAGSQLSFLVPIEKVKRMLSKNRALDTTKLESEIATQIHTWQSPRIQELIDSKWKREEFHGRSVFAEIRKDFQCWGDTNETEDERTVDFAYRSCSAGDNIYIGSELNAGQIEYSFRRVKSVKLNSMQFARFHGMYMYGDNDTDYEHSTNFICQTDFVEATSDHLTGYNRVVTCLRAYKKYTGLYDTQLMIFSHTGEEVLKSYLSLSAVGKVQIQAMHKRFMEQSL